MHYWICHVVFLLLTAPKVATLRKVGDTPTPPAGAGFVAQFAGGLAGLPSLRCLAKSPRRRAWGNHPHTWGWRRVLLIRDCDCGGESAFAVPGALPSGAANLGNVIMPGFSFTALTAVRPSGLVFWGAV